MVNIVVLNVTQTVGSAPATLQQSGALVSQGATNTSPGAVTLLTQLADLTPLLLGGFAITSVAKSNNVATVTTTAAHGFTIGETIFITIAGSSLSLFNGSFLCLITTTTQFTYTLLGVNPGTGSGGVYTIEDVAELLEMGTTFFAQGSGLAVSVLELGVGSPNEGVAALTAYLNANPNSSYAPGALGYFYAYLVPRTWDNLTSFLALIQSYESLTSRTYFFVTSTLQTYQTYTNLMKCVFSIVDSPEIGTWPSNAVVSATSFLAEASVTTLTAHGVLPGQTFSIIGMTPTAYNGTFTALNGTAGTLLTYTLAVNPGTSTVQGTLLASLYANTGITATEFSNSAPFYRLLNYLPSAANLVPPFAFGYMTGVTPFPTRGQGPTLTALKANNTNVIGTGAEGGISNAIILWGVVEDGHDLSYWYSVDWVQINIEIAISAAIINGSNNSQNPLYYNQAGINRLQAVAQQVMRNAIAFGLALGPVTVTAVPFVTYVTQNPSDYLSGFYRGLAVSYTPNRGFTQITFNINVSAFPAGG